MVVLQRGAGSRLGRRAVVGIVTAGAAFGGMGACAAFSPGPCGPTDPSVSPAELAPGGEVRVTAVGLTHGECADALPDSAVYTIEIWAADGRTRTTIGQLLPDSDGHGAGDFRIPDDFPSGDATIRIDVEGVTLACETSGTSICANAWSPVRVSGDTGSEPRLERR